MQVLIISKLFEKNSNNLIDWLYFYNIPFYRINTEDTITNICLYQSNESVNIFIDVNGETLNLQNVKAVFYRKGQLNIKADNKYIIPNQIKDYLYKETAILSEFILSFLTKNKSCFGDYLLEYPNKLGLLHKAKMCGLQIPKTLTSSSKNEILHFIDDNKSVITKSIAEALAYTDIEQKIHYAAYTEEITSTSITVFNDICYPFLVQENITKKYELRIFFFEKKLFPMAIFSQDAKETQTDWRKNNKNTRKIPYKLPKNIEDKLLQFIDMANFTTGSIDMIVSSQNEYFFLEINPSGQFSMVSENCNYHIEEKIAKFLIQ